MNKKIFRNPNISYLANIIYNDILQTPVQVDEERLLFTLDDETYEIHYTEMPEEVILEIAESIIEQAE